MVCELQLGSDFRDSDTLKTLKILKLFPEVKFMQLVYISSFRDLRPARNHSSEW